MRGDFDEDEIDDDFDVTAAAELFGDVGGDCAMDRHGHCGKAGSEECDWECPYGRAIKN